jgi:hypothetical protein
LLLIHFNFIYFRDGLPGARGDLGYPGQKGVTGPMGETGEKVSIN